MPIKDEYLKEIFLDDPLAFEKMLFAFEKSNLKDAFRQDLKDNAVEGLTKDEAEKRVNFALERKAWLLKSIKKRSQIKANFSPNEKIELYKGMLLTRATDNALKHLFLSGEITYKSRSFQGKGFRSLGQEAIYGAPLQLKHGPQFQDNDTYLGDIAAPLIRDLGVFLAMSGNDVETAINAQAGKMGKPSDGRDLHLGDLKKGLLMPAAPLAIATCTLLGFALAFKRRNEARVAISFIGEGGTSLGEWHEAINLASVLSLPMIFCVENNQTALSTPVGMQSRARVFADKALGYGINSLVIDGNDVEEVAASFKFACGEARKGLGPILIELETMRMCGHAHHDDMLYLGADPVLDFDIKPLKGNGYADAELFDAWRSRDPIKTYEKKLTEQGLLSEIKKNNFIEETTTRVFEAVENVKARPWPKFSTSDQALVFRNPTIFVKKNNLETTTRHFSSDGMTYLQAIAKGIRQAFDTHKNCLVIGEDVAPPYGNAFMMFRGFEKHYKDRFINTPISENAIVGACVGLALSGFLPIGEIQFNDFVACAMDQMANNAAKVFFRTGLNVPMVLRMPYGGMRRAGPFHSQDTSPWFYRTPGLKIMAPSTPIDALNMIQRAVFDPDPVLFFEHIALYREPKIKQKISNAKEAIEGAALINAGEDLTIISYGAYVHVAKNAAEVLERTYQKTADVIDLRYLMPIDFATIHASIKRTSKVLLLGEDAKTGSILESIASSIGQELFSDLDAPVTILGSRNTPVPYAPSLEDDYLLNEKQIIDAAVKLIAY